MNLEKSVNLSYPAADVWAIMSDFYGAAFELDRSLAESLDVIKDEMGRPLRVIVFKQEVGGGRMTEQMESLDNEGMTFEYSIPDPGPMPFRNYRGRVEVKAIGKGKSHIRWSCVCEVEKSAEDQMRQFADMGMGNLFSDLAAALDAKAAASPA